MPDTLTVRKVPCLIRIRRRTLLKIRWERLRYRWRWGAEALRRRDAIQRQVDTRVEELLLFGHYMEPDSDA